MTKMILLTNLLSLIYCTQILGQLTQVQERSIYIINAEYTQGTTQVKIKNDTGSTIHSTLEFVYLASETEEGIVTFEKNVKLKSGITNVKLHEPKICDGVVRLNDENGKKLASRKLSDGSWTIHNSSDLFFQRVFPEERSFENDAYLIERNIIVVPRLYNKVYLSRTLNKDHNAIDLRSFNKLVFDSEELDELQLTIETSDGNYSLDLSGIEDGEQTVTFDSLLDSTGTPLNPKEVVAFHFELKGYNLAKPIRLENMRLIKEDSNLSKRSVSEVNKSQIFPNPTNGALSIIDDKQNLISFELYNYGQVLLRKSQSLKRNNTLDLSDLPSGTYFLKLNSLEGSTVEKIIKI